MGNAQSKRMEPVSILPIDKWTVQWPGTLAQCGITAGIFGGSILFSIIISDIPPPRPNSPFDAEKVRLFLAASWVCWSAVLAFSASIVLLYTDEMLTLLFRSPLFIDKDGDKGKEKKAKKRASTIITLLVLAGTSLIAYAMFTAYILMGLAVVAYIAWVGWIIVVGGGLLITTALLIHNIIHIAMLVSFWKHRDPNDTYEPRIFHVFVITEEDREIAERMNEERDHAKEKRKLERAAKSNEKHAEISY